MLVKNSEKVNLSISQYRVNFETWGEKCLHITCHLHYFHTENYTNTLETNEMILYIFDDDRNISELYYMRTLECILQNTFTRRINQMKR